MADSLPQSRSLRDKFGPEAKIIHAFELDHEARVLVIGDPENGVYEWAYERNGKVEEHSDLQYGNVAGALRDGLMKVWPPMDDHRERTFPICKDHTHADWNQPTLDDDACVLCRLFYLEAQEDLLERWQQRALKAEDAIKDMERPLDAQMARLNAEVVRLNTENELLRKAASLSETADSNVRSWNNAIKAAVDILRQNANACTRGGPAEQQNWPFVLETMAREIDKMKRQEAWQDRERYRKGMANWKSTAEAKDRQSCTFEKRETCSFAPSSTRERITGTVEQLRFHLSALVDQCERGNLTDDHGHDFKMNRVLVEARDFLRLYEVPSAIAPSLEIAREQARIVTQGLYRRLHELTQNYIVPCAECEHGNCAVLRDVRRIMDEVRPESINGTTERGAAE